MGNTCKTCINNDDGLCDRKKIKGTAVKKMSLSK